MIDTELLEKTLAELYPEDMENYQEKRDIFKAGLLWGYDHPYFDKGCPNRVWHYLTKDPEDLPEANRICLIKFSDGTGGVSSMILKTKNQTTTSPSNPLNPRPATPGNPIKNPGHESSPGILPSSGDILHIDDEDNTYKVWVTLYRDDIIAWSYYVMDKVNGSYV